MFEDTVCWRGVTSEHVHWWFDCSAVAAPTEDRREGELCTVSPSFGSLGPSQSISLTVSIRSEVLKTGMKKTHVHYDGSLFLSLSPPFSYIYTRSIVNIIHFHTHAGIATSQFISLDLTLSLTHTHTS